MNFNFFYNSPLRPRVSKTFIKIVIKWLIPGKPFYELKMQQIYSMVHNIWIKALLIKVFTKVKALPRE